MHRVPPDATTASPEPSAAQREAKKTERRKPEKTGSARQRKAIRFQRHGCLSRLVKHKLTKYALAVNFFRWCSIARHLAVAGQSEGVDAVMEDGPSSSPEGGATGGRGLAPKRARDSSTKAMAVRE